MQKTIRTGLLALTMAFGSALVPAAVSADSLADVMADAYRNSDILDQNRYLLRLQDESVAQQVAGLRPVINFVAQSSWDEDFDSQADSLALVMNMSLYEGGARLLARDAAQEMVLSTRQSLVALEQSVLLDAATAYMQVWRDIQVVQVRESNVRVITQQLRAAEDRFEVGEDTRTDVAQAQAALSSARRDLVSAQGQLMISRELFSLAVGRDSNGLTGPGALPSLPPSIDEADAIGRQNHPSISALRHEARANELSLEAARRAYRPSLDLGVSSSVDPSDGEGSGSITLTLTQPIYSGGRLGSNERIALATLHAVESELNQQARLVSQSVGNAYANVRIASASIQASQQQIRANQLAFEGVREEASLGARTTLDVLDAEQDLLDARIGLIDAQASLYTASYGLLASMGLLTVENLGLNVPEYDVTQYYDHVDGAPARLPTVRGDRLDAVLERMGRN